MIFFWTLLLLKTKKKCYRTYQVFLAQSHWLVQTFKQKTNSATYYYIKIATTVNYDSRAVDARKLSQSRGSSCDIEENRPDATRKLTEQFAFQIPDVREFKFGHSNFLLSNNMQKDGQWFVAQLVERSLPTPEVRSSNPVIGKLLNRTFYQFTVICFEKTKIKKKRPGMAHFLKEF